MKKVFSTNKSDITDLALLILRIGVAAIMLTHGVPKLIALLSGEPVQFPPIMGMSPAVSLALTVFAEVLCSIFLLVGFATRLAVIPLIITMAIAAFFIHFTDPFSVKEPALQFLLVYLMLLFAGSGKYSVDNILQARKVSVKENKMR